MEKEQRDEHNRGKNRRVERIYLHQKQRDTMSNFMQIYKNTPK
jgi:hypothetical protein